MRPTADPHVHELTVMRKESKDDFDLSFLSARTKHNWGKEKCQDVHVSDLRLGSSVSQSQFIRNGVSSRRLFHPAELCVKITSA